MEEIGSSSIAGRWQGANFGTNIIADLSQKENEEIAHECVENILSDYTI